MPMIEEEEEEELFRTKGVSVVVVVKVRESATRPPEEEEEEEEEVDFLLAVGLASRANSCSRLLLALFKVVEVSGELLLREGDASCSWPGSRYRPKSSSKAVE